MIWWLAAASAYEPELDVHALFGLGVPETTEPVLVGGGAALAFPTVRPLHLELGGDFALRSQRGRWGALVAGPRLFLWSPDEPVVSIVVRGGLAYETSLSPVIEAGMSLDLETKEAIRPRITVQYAYSLTETSRLLVQAGAVFGRRDREPVDEEPVATPAVVAPRPPFRSVEPGMVWLPNPVCEWTPTDEATIEIERLGLSTSDLSVVSTRLMRAPDAPLVPVTLPLEQQGPRPGRIVVATSDYDHVTVDGEEVIIDGGAGVIRAPEGMVWTEVVGGGRTLRLPLAAAVEHAVWLPVDPPTTTHVTFGSGQTRLSAQASIDVQRLIEQRGDWSYHVQGSFSEEGNLTTNLALADRRAQVVADALIAGGVPAGAVVVVPSAGALPGLPPEKQRAAVVIPVEVP